MYYEFYYDYMNKLYKFIFFVENINYILFLIKCLCEKNNRLYFF